MASSGVTSFSTSSTLSIGGALVGTMAISGTVVVSEIATGAILHSVFLWGRVFFSPAASLHVISDKKMLSKSVVFDCRNIVLHRKTPEETRIKERA